jgi:hypothetical protein
MRGGYGRKGPAGVPAGIGCRATSERARDQQPDQAYGRSEWGEGA